MMVARPNQGRRAGGYPVHCDSRAADGKDKTSKQEQENRAVDEAAKFFKRLYASALEELEKT